ncbi:MAG: hypothetical protein J2P16_07460 [Mycobacterium sp.]|nr:hypothetical protein [Mycobacterium sp.]
MFAQLVVFDGPRSSELVAAADRARRDRILPLLSADPQLRGAHRGTFVLRRHDGAEVVLALSDTVEGIQHAHQLVLTSTLLPDEDPALLPGPDRVDLYEVVYAADADFAEYETQS